MPNRLVHIHSGREVKTDTRPTASRNLRKRNSQSSKFLVADGVHSLNCHAEGNIFGERRKPLQKFIKIYCQTMKCRGLKV